MRWSYGDTIVRREVLNDGRPWMASVVYVVDDSDEQLVTYTPSGARFGFLDGAFPTESGRHPWEDVGKQRWEGHGVLQIQRPGDDHAVWCFWTGADRVFRTWYVNIQEAFRRTPIGFDTQDLELDIVVSPDGTWELKDADIMDQRTEEGRFHPAQVKRVFALGDELIARLRAGDWWWDETWSSWEPDPAWDAVDLPADWAAYPTR
jgi:hypothetical protein